MARDTIYTLYKTGRTDPTRQNIWGFSSEEQRRAWLNSKSPTVFLNQKYWRVTSSIKIPVRYEDSFDYDYVEIVNNSSSDKKRTWFCFITGRAYLNNNCTMLELDVDYVQTFYYSTVVDGVVPFWNISGFTSKSTMNVLPNRGEVSDYPVPESTCMSFNWAQIGYGVVIYSSVDLTDLSSVNYRTAIIDGQYTAAPPYIMLENVASITDLINRVNNLGITDAIAGMYLFPLDYIDVTLLTTSPQIATNASFYKELTYTVSKPTNCGGYVPENKVLLGYDYSYFTVNNGQGEVQTFHFEDFNGTPTFKSRISFASGCPTVFIYPSNYIDSDQNNFRQRIMKITQAPACSYLNDSYRIWLAQTQNSRAASFNEAQTAINQAETARRKSYAYQVYTMGNSPIETLRQKSIKAALDSSDYYDYLNSGSFWERLDKRNPISRMTMPFVVKNIGSSPLLGTRYSSSSNGSFGGGTSSGGGAGSSFRTNDDTQNMIDITNIAALHVRKALGIEKAYQYDFDVENAQNSMNKLLAGWDDKSRIPATAVGSNAYGDACAYQQYGFMIAVFTPTAEYAEIIDKMLTASGHTINKYIFFTRSHQYFDFIAMPSPEIVSNINDRPEWVRKMLIGLLQSGVYIWHVKDGDISDHFGIPYGLPNPSV